jgi:DNA replication protein DnaC
MTAPVDFADVLSRFDRRFRESHERRLAASTNQCVECDERVINHGSRCETHEALWQAQQRTLGCPQKTARALPTRYADATFKGDVLAARVRDKAAIAAAIAACGRTDIDRITLRGPSGVGKTTLACAIAMRVSYERRIVGTFIRSSDLATARSTTRLGAESDVVRQAFTCPLLVLDDFGVGDASAYSNAVPDVIAARYDARALTVVTTSVEEEAAALVYGAGTIRRIFEPVGCAMIEMAFLPTSNVVHIRRGDPQ